MEPRTYEMSIRRMLGNDSDPFRNGTDCCCIVHTEAGRYKQLLNEMRAIVNGWYSDSDTRPDGITRIKSTRQAIFGKLPTSCIDI